MPDLERPHLPIPAFGMSLERRSGYARDEDPVDACLCECDAVTLLRGTGGFHDGVYTGAWP